MIFHRRLFLHCKQIGSISLIAPTQGSWSHIRYQVGADQEVVGQAPHPSMSQDCPKHQGVAQDGDHLAVRWILSESKATKATQYNIKSIMLEDTLYLKLS